MDSEESMEVDVEDTVEEMELDEVEELEEMMEVDMEEEMEDMEVDEEDEEEPMVLRRRWSPAAGQAGAGHALPTGRVGPLLPGWGWAGWPCSGTRCPGGSGLWWQKHHPACPVLALGQASPVPVPGARLPAQLGSVLAAESHCASVCQPGDTGNSPQGWAGMASCCFPLFQNRQR